MVGSSREFQTKRHAQSTLELTMRRECCSAATQWHTRQGRRHLSPFAVQRWRIENWEVSKTPARISQKPSTCMGCR